MSPSAPSVPPPKRARRSREAYKPPRDRKELAKAIGAGAAVVVLSLGAVLFLGRDHLGSDSPAPVTTVTTLPAGSATTPTVVPGTTPPAGTPTPTSAPAGSETATPTAAPATSTTLPGAPTP
jgi:hypothetical protein